MQGRSHTLRLLLACGAAGLGATACGASGGEPTAPAPAASPTEIDTAALVDHHAHVFSLTAQRWLEQTAGASSRHPAAAADLTPVMRAQRVDKAVVLSSASSIAPEGHATPEQVQALSAENDWVAAEAASHADRLVAFFSVNPLSDSALDEIERAAATERFSGMTVDLAESGIDLRNPDHVRQLQRVFERANGHRLVISIHLRTKRADYGRADAKIFIDQVLAEAPDTTVQIAQLAGGGGYDEATDAALGAFIDGFAAGEIVYNAVYFDIAGVVRNVKAGAAGRAAWWPAKRYERLVERLRTLGLDRVLFGTDWPAVTPRAYAAEVATKVPLTERELRKILANRAPWVR
jgi:predicted TIM-barrel fold metal-dependent hydrolase